MEEKKKNLSQMEDLFSRLLQHLVVQIPKKTAK